MMATHRVPFCLGGIVLVLVLGACSGLPAQPVAVAPTVIPTHFFSPSPISTFTTAPSATATMFLSPTPTSSPTVTSTPVVHIVQTGESFWHISRRYGITVESLLEANGLDRKATLRPGDRLVIPQASNQTIAVLAATRIPSDVATAVPAATESTQAVHTTTSLLRQTPATQQPTGPETQPVPKKHSPPTATPTPQPRPAKHTATPLPAGQIVHVVQPGDNLSSIAADNEASIEMIMTANRIEDPTRLRVGQRLVIPIGTKTPLPTATQKSLRPSPTASLPYAAPAILWPINGARLSATEAAALSWTSVGILDPEEYYVVHLDRLHGPEVTQTWTKWAQEPSLHISPKDRIPEPTKGHLYRWSVIVMRHTGTEKDGTWTGLPLSAPSESRRFVWPVPVEPAVDQQGKGQIPLPSLPSTTSPQ